jgi:hypothetical protein
MNVRKHDKQRRIIEIETIEDGDNRYQLQCNQQTELIKVYGTEHDLVVINLKHWRPEPEWLQGTSNQSQGMIQVGTNDTLTFVLMSPIRKLILEGVKINGQDKYEITVPYDSVTIREVLGEFIIL